MKKSMIAIAMMVLCDLAVAKDVSVLPEGFVSIMKTDEGCAINNPLPKDGESVSWSGGCVNGLADGYGVLQWYLHGKPTDRYVGEYQAGRIHGVGQYVWRDGVVHTGSWKDDRVDGFAEIVFTGLWQGDVYVGAMQDGKRHGRGTYYSNIHNLGTRRDYGDDFLSKHVAGVTRRGSYLVADAIYEEGGLVAICGKDAHDLCD